MQKVLALSLAAGLLAGADSAEQTAQKQVDQAVRRLNAAFEKGDPDLLRRLMTDDHVAITTYYGKPTSRDDQIKQLGDLKLSEYKTGAVTVRMLGKGVALATYPQSVKGKFKDKVVPASSLATSIFVERDGTWLETFYQETAVGEK
jgi:uncharacterized protein (TIGR02246 family)